MNLDLSCVECPEPVEGLSFFYILQCKNDSFYVGIAEDVSKRVERHLLGKGARHTRILSPFRLVYIEGPMKRSVSRSRETQIKKWSRNKKLALIRGDTAQLKQLSISKDH